MWVDAQSYGTEAVRAAAHSNGTGAVWVEACRDLSGPSIYGIPSAISEPRFNLSPAPQISNPPLKHVTAHNNGMGAVWVETQSNGTGTFRRRRTIMERGRCGRWSTGKRSAGAARTKR